MRLYHVQFTRRNGASQIASWCARDVVSAYVRTLRSFGRITLGKAWTGSPKDGIITYAPPAKAKLAAAKPRPVQAEQIDFKFLSEIPLSKKRDSRCDGRDPAS
jgi:hypothetical protein